MSYTTSTCPDVLCGFRNRLGYCSITACIKHNRTDEIPVPVKVNCQVCDTLESGDTLYSHTSDDIGEVYEAIRDIKFCPKCGKKLLTFQQKIRNQKKEE